MVVFKTISKKGRRYYKVGDCLFTPTEYGRAKSRYYDLYKKK